MACGSCGARYNRANGQVVTGIVDPKAPAPRGYQITPGAALPSPAPVSPSPTAVSSDSQAEQNKSDASEGN